MHVLQAVLSKFTVVIFVISTTGQGDIPGNARKFWKSLLRKRLPPNLLSHVSFTTFGFGDSSYVKYVDRDKVETFHCILTDSLKGSTGLLESSTNVFISWERMKFIQEVRLTSNIQKGQS
jgi:flavodoxin